MNKSQERWHPITRPIDPLLQDLAKEWGISPPIALSRVATRLESRPDMQEEFGVEIYLKREDETDSLGCGHKLRKLSFLMPTVLNAGTTVLITVGSKPSNQCKAVARAAYMCNLRAHVGFLGDHQERPDRALGNYLLTSLLQPSMTWFERTPWNMAQHCLAALEERERADGEHPCVIEPGITQGAGLFASMEMAAEIDRDIQGVDHSRVCIVAPAGSGGTCLGLQLAAQYLRRPWRIYGCLVGETLPVVTGRVASLRSKLTLPFALNVADTGRLILTDIALGDGYDNPRPFEFDTQMYIARRYGLILDWNYMLKTFIGLKRLILSGEITSRDVVVLVHTGGQMGLFDDHRGYTAWYTQANPGWTKPSKI